MPPGSPFKEDATNGDIYHPAMEVKTKEEAAAYFKKIVQHVESFGNNIGDDAVRVAKQNLGYWAGYFSNETRARVEELYACAHPIFGKIEEVGAPTAEEAFQKGAGMGENVADKWMKK